MRHQLQMHYKSTQLQLQAHVIVNETIRGTMIEAELCDEKGGSNSMMRSGQQEKGRHHEYYEEDEDNTQG